MKNEATYAPIALGRAVSLMQRHPNIQRVRVPQVRNGVIDVEAAISVGLPSRWLAPGRSPNGVLPVEPVLFRFPEGFPLRAPRILLRQDFDRSLAHVNPGPPNEQPSPCIYDGNLDELLQRAGIAVILNQLVVWLENAALGRLIDPAQGWEPVRRDSLRDVFVFDADTMRSRVNRDAGHRLFRLEYVLKQSSGRSAIFGTVTDSTTLSPTSAKDAFRKVILRDGVQYGVSVALFVWPGRRATGKLWLAGEYRPETVCDISSLVARAKDYGCDTQLANGLKWVANCLKGGVTSDATVPVAIILCARRPFHLIRSDSDLELCPYIAELDSKSSFKASGATGVRPAGHRDAISVRLLRRMSDTDSSRENPRWIQIGVGSVGSKIALHMARSGAAPSTVVDSGYLFPHNAARHALPPVGDRPDRACFLGKAEAVSNAARQLAQDCAPFNLDVRDVLRNEEQMNSLLPRRAWAAVNSTASLSVREALASCRNLRLRTIETSLFSDGRIGLVAVEGPDRNPNCGDLISSVYELALRDSDLRRVMFEEPDSVRRVDTGLGCGSPTMAIPDGRVSIFAASMAEAIRLLQIEGLPGSGQILIGKLSDDGIGVLWRKFEALPCKVVRERRDSASPLVRISQLAHGRILEEIGRWPGKETGGVLVGRFSDAAETFYVVDVLTAPPDSLRSATHFVLGKLGLRQSLRDYARSCNYALYCLGTWHSHLSPSDPSARDYETARALEVSRLTPSAVVIRTPTDYRLALAT